MRKLLFIIAFLLAIPAYGQQGNTVLIRFPGVPSGDCSAIMVAVDDSTGDYYDCSAVGTWFKVGPGGGGAGITQIDPGANLGPTVTFQVGTTGTDFNISNPAANQVRYNLPTASTLNRGALSAADWTTFNGKAGTGTCVFQVVTATTTGAPTCTTITSAYTTGTFPADAHNILSATHGDSTTAAVTRGGLITGQGVSPTWSLLTKGSASECLQMDGAGTDIVWGSCSAGGFPRLDQVLDPNADKTFLQTDKNLRFTWTANTGTPQFTVDNAMAGFDTVTHTTGTVVAAFGPINPAIGCFANDASVSICSNNEANDLGSALKVRAFDDSTTGNSFESAMLVSQARNTSGDLDPYGLLVSVSRDFGAVGNSPKMYGIKIASGVISGTAGDVASIFIQPSAPSPGASATNYYGISIDNVTGASTNYAIKTGLGQVDFGDTVKGASTINAVTGFQINGAAALGNCLVGDGTNFVSGSCSAGGFPRLDQVLDPNVDKTFSMTDKKLGFTWGNATGAGDLLTLQDSAGNTGSGAILRIIRSDATTNTQEGIYVSGVANSTGVNALGVFTTGTTNGNVNILDVESVNDSSTTGRDTAAFIYAEDNAAPINNRLAGLDVDVVAKHTTGNIPLLQSLSVRTDSSGLGGTATDIEAANFRVGWAGSATATNLTALKIESGDFGNAIDNLYGIKIENQNSGGHTNNYAIKTGLGQVDFGDTVKGASTINAVTGFQINGAGTSGRYLKGDGTNFVISSGSASGVGSCTNQFVTATNSDASPTCTTATLASAQFANQGTTTTLLHGNAGGNPSWSGVSLANDTVANQGTTTTVLHGNAAGQPSFGSVVEGDISLSAVTTNDVSITKHGFTPTLPNDASKFLDGTGNWTTPTASLPSGLIVFIASGTCPAGFTEVAGLSGKFILGTTAAGGDVGTTGGSTSYTPAGTINVVVDNHADHTHNYTQVPNHVHPETGPTSASGGTVTIGQDTNASGSTAANLNTANPTGGVATAVTLGSNSVLTHTVSTKTFAGTPATITPPYIKLIGCQSN